MSEFVKFNQAVSKQLAAMAKGSLFVVDVPKDALWDTYLKTFPEGTNPVYLERTEHDCNCCRQFIKTIGAVVAVDANGNLSSIWDVTVDSFYQHVADALAALVKQAKVVKPFFYYEATIGTRQSQQLLENQTVKVWEHFYAPTPKDCLVNKKLIDSRVGELTATFDVFKRSMEELSQDSAELVLELIAQNSLYRGTEFKSAVKQFLDLKKKYSACTNKDSWLWSMVMANGHALRFRNTVIGTLLTDISDGVDLDTAVKSYEQKVAPANYKRTTALVTQKMIDAAKNTVDELGLEDSMHRRYAVASDVTIDNMLFADRSIKPALGAFDALKPTQSAKSISKVEEITADKFVADVLPFAESVEVMFDHSHTKNLVSLIAPDVAGSPSLMKWDNGFSWSYNGEVTDSIAERVKNAGGTIDADARVSLSWYNYDDLDLHVHTPKSRIYFGNRNDNFTGGCLDIDMNAGSGTSRNAVENIFWKNKSRMVEGEYRVIVNNFSKRESADVGFTVQLAVGDTIYTFVYDRAVPNKGDVEVLTFNYSRAKGITIVKSITGNAIKSNVWGITTSEFHKVSAVMYSPNHWDGAEIGNKHLFFMIDQCANPEPARGFYNEFLKAELTPHRKVFELLSSKMKTPESTDQLSGLGFSFTKRDSVTVKVSGKFNRVLKVNF